MYSTLIRVSLFFNTLASSPHSFQALQCRSAENEDRPSAVRRRRAPPAPMTQQVLHNRASLRHVAPDRELHPRPPPIESSPDQKPTQENPDFTRPTRLGYW